VHGYSEGDGLRFGDRLGGIVREIRLGQHDHRVGAAVPRGGQVALEPPRLEVAHAVGDEEDGVDVRRDDLLLCEPRFLAREARSPRQDGTDDRPILPGDQLRGHPVSGDGVTGGGYDTRARE
jgi:hypothetical protein